MSVLLKIRPETYIFQYFWFLKTLGIINIIIFFKHTLKSLLAHTLILSSKFVHTLDENTYLKKKLTFFTLKINNENKNKNNVSKHPNEFPFWTHYWKIILKCVSSILWFRLKHTHTYIYTHTQAQLNTSNNKWKRKK